MLRLFSSKDESVNILIHAIEMNPNDAVAHFRIGLALSKDVGKDVEGYSFESDCAIDYYTKAIEIDPNYADAYYHRGLLREYLARYFHTGEVEDYLAGCCEISTYLEDIQLAIDDYAQAIKIDPNYADAYTSMGQVLNAVKNFKDLTEKLITDQNLQEKKENQLSMKSINDYPSVGFTETQYLPAEAGCYLILNALNAILYVGKATNIRKRHENKSHHRFNDFTLANAARIAFKTCELEDLDKLESSLIEHFKPTLNVAKANSGTNADALIDGKTIEQCLERYVELAPVLKEIQAEIEALKPAVTEYVFSNGGKVEGPGWNLRATSSAKHTNTARRFSCSKKSYKSCKSKRKRMG